VHDAIQGCAVATVACKLPVGPLSMTLPGIFKKKHTDQKKSNLQMRLGAHVFILNRQLLTLLVSAVFDRLNNRLERSIQQGEL
jgi:hypothetical protein